jgi:hypothetical protein
MPPRESVLMTPGTSSATCVSQLGQDKIQICFQEGLQLFYHYVSLLAVFHSSGAMCLTFPAKLSSAFHM